MGRYAFKLPDVGEGTAQAELVEWRVKPGDEIVEDQPLVDVMTEKATVEIPAPVAGKVLSITGAPGEMLAVGSTILLMEVAGPGNADATLVEAAPPAPETKPAPAPEPAPVALNRHAVETRAPGEKPIASPAVRRRALEAGVALSFVAGGGPGGRITQEDLDAFIGSGGAAVRSGPPAGRAPQTATEDVKLIGLRRTIATRMQDAKRRIPHFSYIEEIDVTDLEVLRGVLNGEFGKTRAKLTLLPFLAKAMVRALPKWPQINARHHDDDGFVRRYSGVHLGVATQTPNGLVVPVVRHAETLTLWECAAEISRLATAAREGKASRDELGGSTITITSLGALGGLATTPVINYPEVAIVGVNKIAERPVVRDGAVVVRKMMNLSSSFDHRVVDGWDAAEFVQRLRALLEAPALLLAD